MSRLLAMSNILAILCAMTAQADHFEADTIRTQPAENTKFH